MTHTQHTTEVCTAYLPKNELGRSKECEERRKKKEGRKARGKNQGKGRKRLGEHVKITFLLTYYYLLC